MRQEREHISKSPRLRPPSVCFDSCILFFVCGSGTFFFKKNLQDGEVEARDNRMESCLGHGRHALDHLQFLYFFLCLFFFVFLVLFFACLGHGRDALDHLQVAVYIIYVLIYT